MSAYRRLKGLTVKVVIFISVHGVSDGFNRLAVYTALTRSSCTFSLFKVKIEDMCMKEYQIGKMIFDKEKMKDTGFERRENYTYYDE